MMRHQVTFVITAALALAAPALGDEIALKGSVRLAAGANTIRLQDIATLSGPLAERYADLTIASFEQRTDPLEISVQQVRRLLTDAGAHWGKIQLNGRTVIVRPAAPASSTPPLAMTAIALDGAKPKQEKAHRVVPELATELLVDSTLRSELARVIVTGLGSNPAAIRLIFEDRDQTYLDRPLDGVRYEIQPLSSFRSDRIDVRVRTWSGTRILDSRSLVVRALVSVEAAVLQRAVSRNQEILEADLAVESRWLPVGQADQVCSLVGAVGRMAATSGKIGAILRKTDLRREMIIERGDRVMVRCLVGGIVITLEAESRGDAAEGEPVELRKLGERETFLALATGPGAAIVDLSR